MIMENVILSLVLLAIVGGAALYVYKAKKRGEKCIGCPHSKQCKNSDCSCGKTE